MITFKDVTYSYPSAKLPAICDLNIEIGTGESICIMGGNGSGKSTLAALAAGLHDADTGSIIVGDGSQADMRVGLLFQNPDNQFVAVIVEKEIAFGLENLGLPLSEIDQKIADTLDSFSIPQLRRRLTAELSGGEKQRVALASIMALNPQILILDEPDSYLDQIGKQALEQELDRLRKQAPDMTEIRITQYPQVAKRYHRLIVLANGRVVADDSPNEVFADQTFCEEHGLALSEGETAAMPAPTGHPRSFESTEADIREIALYGVSFGYPGGPPVFEGLDLTLKTGEILGVVGCSGTGKTSLGHLLCGLQKPTGGTITFFDRHRKEIRPVDLPGRVSGAFQFPERQFFLMTCIQELKFGPQNLGQKLSDDRINALFELVGLNRESFSERDPVTLSVGEKRRLAFATVLAMSPGFILFDEPTCGLDQAGVGMFIEMVRQLKKNGAGLIVISHDGDVINRLADRLLVMSKGERSQILTPSAFSDDKKLSALLSVPERTVSSAV